ncbi:PREDICTED: ATPase family AAA domain-containing protein 5 [Eufriesea mexicana]|uniref:ATPase family AAA domain-containing protein 5 n=1 Tax=Eufriesea mexicana TaxID=516756 RepID=UPI00083BBAFE|nr:PREDICTED: ATPase family AAA domain-containing protein 5 [Eufriesea mexicana]
MKNITQYFEDTVQSNNSITIHSSDDTKKETKYKEDSKQKRSHKKVKLSQTNVKEKLCDIVEKNGDMINKTLSTLAKVNNGNSNETYIKSFSRGLRTNFKRNKFIHQSLDHLDLETNDFNVKNKKRSEKDNLKICLSNDERYKKELSKKTNINKNVSINNTLENKEMIDSIELIDIDSNDKIENIREESNAFQILMSRNKTGQCISPIKLPQKEEINIKKSEECKEKLKHSKEKLVALADKKGYSKRKLIEMEEGEKIEQMIQNRIKFFKGEDKKDNSISTTVLNHKQPAGSLLNYFSKTPGDLIHTNMANMSTIVVKADVHMTENSIKHELYKTNSSNKIQPSKKNKKSEFSQIDDIRIIESENINILNNKKKLQDEQQHNKHRWSLRIKLQTYEDENASLGESSDDELFSPSTNKLNIESYEKFKAIKNVDVENLSIKNNSKRGISKQVNECTKSKLISESSKHNDAIHDSKYLKNKLENKKKLIRLNQHESALIENKNLNNYNNTNIENITRNKQNQEDCIIIHDNSLERKTIDKLAPLFTKRKKPDPNVIAARRLFLQPDITDNNNKNANRKVNVYGILPFSLISHVTQSSNLFSNETDIFNIPKEICNDYNPIIDVNNFKHLIDLSKKKFKALGKVNKPKIQEVLMDIEKHCSNVKDMWSVISLIVKEQPNKIILTKTRSKKNKQSEKKEGIEDSFECCSWTYKYRPKSSQEIVGNEEAVAKLKEWLLGWKAIFTNEDVSSGDEFYSSDSSSSKMIENNQVAVLLGPHGCGKTASVYAVANEFGYTVLELNASSRRTGKKLLKELKEATKSHRIKKDEKTSAFCNLASDEIILKEIPQNSLILIEDVDIIFEEDEGFISATYQLATNTKRPIVMTCRDICPHLNKMAPQQNRIYFKNADSNRVSALIELISLAETGYRLSSNCITELLQSGDMRKAILQLQYLLLSGPPQIIEQTINFKNSFWQNIRHYVYKPAIKVSKKWKKTTNKKVMDDKNILIDVATKLDNIALLSSLIDIEDSALNLCQIKTQPNLSLIENTAPYSASTDMCLDIAEWIGNKIIYKDQLNDYDGTQHQNNIMLKKQLNEGLNLALSQTTSLLLDRQIIATDYLPSIRTICRAEELRANTNNKRGNRFFHYLHNLKTPSTLFKPNILAAACKIMYDKVDNDMRIEKNNTSFI